MQEKKNILTYEGLRKYEDELHDLKVVKRQEVAQKLQVRSKRQESRETCPRTLSTMQRRMSRETSKPVSKNWRRS